MNIKFEMKCMLVALTRIALYITHFNRYALNTEVSLYIFHNKTKQTYV